MTIRQVLLEGIPIIPEVQIIRGQRFDIHDVDNRRFAYNPTNKTLVLGINNPFAKSGLISSHAEELGNAPGRYDDYIKGWVGTSARYPDGVIHFAPSISKRVFSLSPNLANAVLDTVEMFIRNGANGNTVLRNVVYDGEIKIKKSEFKNLL
jgi:hypothetical protein